MKLRSVVTASMLSLFSATCFAGYSKDSNDSMTNLFSPSRIALQGAIVTGGNFSIGLVNYAEKTELGVSLSATVNNASNQTKTITPDIFAGLRKALGQLTYFAYGMDLAGTFGRNAGMHISSDYQVGPYISLEQMLTSHIMLSGWIQPYQYQYAKIGGVSTSTNSFFSTGGLAINYLF